MRMRRIPTTVHGVIDYVTAPVLVAAPDIFRMRQASPAAIAPRATGAAAAVLSTLTDYEFGVKRLIPMPVHLAFDGTSGAALAAIPWLSGAARTGKRYWLPHAIVGAAEVALALTTRTKPARTKPGKVAQIVRFFRR